MVVENKFPLTLWEQTDEYKTELATAQERFKQLATQLRNKNKQSPSLDVTFADNCIPAVWINGHQPLSNRWNADEAFNSAKRHGTFGYFRVDDLEDFLEDEGFVVEEAMDSLGFRRHRKDPSRWAKKQKQDKIETPYHRKWGILFGKEYETPDREERTRLTELLTVKNVNTQLGKTFSISVGRSGLIFVALDANPFAGHSAQTLGELSAQLAQKAHISKNQEGFDIQARNIKLCHRPETGCNYNAVHIVATRSDKTIGEVVWPAIVSLETLLNITTSFRDKLTSVR